jgi:hypothetical protein
MCEFAYDQRPGLVRPRHQRKELEALLREAEAKGWRVDRAKGYFKMYCPCPEKHIVSVRLTPSGSRYEQNRRVKLRSQTCWEA